MIVLTYKQFARLLEAARDNDRIWPNLRQLDWYADRAWICRENVLLILPR